jgi:hypothetical protein
MSLLFGTYTIREMGELAATKSSPIFYLDWNPLNIGQESPALDMNVA